MKRNNLLTLINAAVWTFAALSYTATAFSRKDDWWPFAMIPLCFLNATLNWLTYFLKRKAK